MVWDDGVDIKKESIWDEGVERPDSIQQRVFEMCRDEGFELIFNDDDPGEAADLVCMRRDVNKIRIRLVHCKFSGEPTPGVRLDDVVEVASQAVRSARWRHSFEDLCKHIEHRERVLFGKPEGFRYLQGDRSLLNTFKAEGRFRELEYEVICVQPGVTKTRISNGQRMILGAANRYLIQTAELPISVWCSA